MTEAQWNALLRVIRGELLDPLPVGLIIDSPWLPGWAGVSMLDYFADDQVWFEANRKAANRFPKIMLLPGFWSEYGMCTEPSAFGAKCVWPQDTFPHPRTVLHEIAEIDRLKKPNCATDGLLPFVLRRLERSRPAIEAAGHRIRFATARGPLNIASYLLGQTEFLVGLKTDPDEIHRLLATVTEFLIEWIGLQADTFDSIDGIFLLDDLIGFLGDADFQQFALPYLKQIYESRKVAVRFLHNDAAGMITARHLAAMGVNLFNFSFNHSLEQMRNAAGPSVVLLGNIPPRDVLAAGSAEDVRRGVAEMLATVADRRGIIVSCGGGAPPDAPSENLDAMVAAANAAEKTARHSCDQRSRFYTTR
jgi:uroporphyrinogen-III decarboxylase